MDMLSKGFVDDTILINKINYLIQLAKLRELEKIALKLKNKIEKSNYGDPWTETTVGDSNNEPYNETYGDTNNTKYW